MKPTILLTAAITLSGGIWLRAQQSDPASPGIASASEEAKSAQCKAMCAMKHSSQDSANPLAWDQELNLTDQQRTRLRAIKEKASNEAKDLLTAEQQDKLKELATRQSMMQCMRSMKHAGPAHGEMGHGASVGCCSQMHGKGDETHSSH